MNDTNELTEKQLNELLLITRESINESLLNIKENSNLFELCFPDVKTPLHYIDDNMYDNEACYGNNEVNEMSELTDKQLDTLFITAQKYTNNQGLNLKENSNLSKLVGYDTIETGKKEKPTLCIECNIQEKAKGRTKCYQCIYRGRKLKPQKKEKPTLCIECNINKRGSNRAKCYQCIYRIRVEKNPKKEKTTLCIECNINEKKKNRRRCHECIYRNNIAKPI